MTGNYRTKLTLYLLLFLYNIVFLGLVGIKGGITKFNKKLVIQKDYEKALDNFAKKDTFVEGLLTQLGNNQELVNQLNVAIPDRTEEEIYLVDLSLRAAIAGYEIKSLSLQKTSPTQTDLTVTFLGDLSSLNRLADTLFSMDRLTQTNSIVAEADRNQGKVVVSLTIYNYIENQ